MSKSRLILAIALVVVGVSASVRGGDAARPDGQGERRMLNPAELFALMQSEAEKGSGPAMLNLGTMYERGIGAPRSFTKAFEWYQKAAEVGVAEGYYNLGVCYEIGIGNSGSVDKAFFNFEKSAELGLSQGLYKLASLYFLGYGTPKNESWGVELLARAAEAGHMNAANDLGVIYFDGAFGRERDLEKAYAMFVRSAELGNAEAMKNVAVFYREGLGRPADQVQELVWYTLALRAGYPRAVIEPVVQSLHESLGAEGVKRAEALVETWIAGFQERQQVAQARK